jgi:hypothetical protein
MKEPKNIVESMFLEEKNKVASIIQTAKGWTAGTGRPYGMPSSDN